MNTKNSITIHRGLFLFIAFFLVAYQECHAGIFEVFIHNGAVWARDITPWPSPSAGIGPANEILPPAMKPLISRIIATVMPALLILVPAAVVAEGSDIPVVKDTADGVVEAFVDGANIILGDVPIPVPIKDGADYVCECFQNGCQCFKNGWDIMFGW